MERDCHQRAPPATSTPVSDSERTDTFRGWLRPGPVPPGGVAVEPGETLDFLCGHWRIFQAERGHRYSIDDVVCAHYAVTCAPRVQRHLDLGSGIGSVALQVAWRLPGIDTTTIEAQATSARLARKSVAYNGIASRYQILEGDLRDERVLERACEKGAFDLVTGSPPYWPVGSALAAAHPQAVPARLEVRGDVSDYARAAMRVLAPGGVFVCVHQASQHARVLAALESAGLCVVRTKGVVFKEGVPLETSGARLYCAHRKQDVPTTLHHAPVEDEPIVARDRDGHTPPAYAALRLSFGFPPGNVAKDGV
jgi:tRNA1Val (adenine37-N6)-methyltransferase